MAATWEQQKKEEEEPHYQNWSPAQITHLCRLAGTLEEDDNGGEEEEVELQAIVGISMRKGRIIKIYSVGLRGDDANEEKRWH